MSAVYSFVNAFRPSCFPSFQPRLGSRRVGLLRFFFAGFLLAAATSPHGLFSQLTPVKVLDSSALIAPAGARVAIVEFDDLECPTCAHFNPLLKQAAANYKIPWVRHDFLIPYHIWSRQAAINARFFDTTSVKLGDDYRDYIFTNQNSIETLPNLSTWTQKFAQAHGFKLPPAVDPMGILAQKVQADCDLGKRIGISGTPTIFIVCGSSKNAAYTQVLNPDRDLYHTIDQALEKMRGL
jgi:protein-disulfide isomerase